MFSVEILGKTEKHKEEKHTLYPNVQRYLMLLFCYVFTTGLQDGMQTILTSLVSSPCLWNQADPCEH